MRSQNVNIVEDRKCCTLTRPLKYGITPINQELPALDEAFIQLIYRKPPQVIRELAFFRKDLLIAMLKA